MSKPTKAGAAPAEARASIPPPILFSRGDMDPVKLSGLQLRRLIAETRADMVDRIRQARREGVTYDDILDLEDAIAQRMRL